MTVATDMIGSDQPFPHDVVQGRKESHMSWDDVRSLVAQGFEIGSHSCGHADFGLISLAPVGGPGISIFQFNQIFYGLLVVAFLIFEPLGLYGIWIKVRNYWKGWPFSY